MHCKYCIQQIDVGIKILPFLRTVWKTPGIVPYNSTERGDSWPVLQIMVVAGSLRSCDCNLGSSHLVCNYDVAASRGHMISISWSQSSLLTKDYLYWSILFLLFWILQIVNNLVVLPGLGYDGGWAPFGSAFNPTHAVMLCLEEGWKCVFLELLFSFGALTVEKFGNHGILRK